MKIELPAEYIRYLKSGGVIEGFTSGLSTYGTALVHPATAPALPSHIPVGRLHNSAWTTWKNSPTLFK